MPLSSSSSLHHRHHRVRECLREDVVPSSRCRPTIFDGDDDDDDEVQQGEASVVATAVFLPLNYEFDLYCQDEKQEKRNMGKELYL